MKGHDSSCVCEQSEMRIKTKLFKKLYFEKKKKDKAFVRGSLE